MKFDVNVPWVVPSQNIVFYWLILISGRAQLEQSVTDLTMNREVAGLIPSSATLW